MALDLLEDFDSNQYLEKKTDRFVTKFCICLDIDKVKAWIVARHSSLIYTRVMVLNLPQTFVRAHYIRNKLTDFYHIVYMHCH